MKIEAFNKLVNEWRDAVVAGDCAESQKTSTALSFYFFSASKRAKGEKKEAIKRKAREVFGLIKAPINSIFGDRLKTLVTKSMFDYTETKREEEIKREVLFAKKELNDMWPSFVYKCNKRPKNTVIFSIYKLMFVLQEAFPEDCLATTDLESKAKGFIEKLRTEWKNYKGEVTEIEEASLDERKKYLKEFSKLFDVHVLEKEFDFEAIPYTSNSVHETAQIVTLVTAPANVFTEILTTRSKKIGVYPNKEVYLAAAKLFLQRFYEKLPDMMDSKYSNSLKLVSLWMAIKVLEEDNITITEFLEALRKRNYLSEFSPEENEQIIKWMYLMEIKFLQTIDYDVSFENVEGINESIQEITHEVVESRKAAGYITTEFDMAKQFQAIVESKRALNTKET